MFGYFNSSKNSAMELVEIVFFIIVNYAPLQHINVENNYGDWYNILFSCSL